MIAVILFYYISDICPYEIK